MEVQIQNKTADYFSQIKTADEKIKNLSSDLFLIKKDLDFLISKEFNSFEEFEKMEKLVEEELGISQEISFLTKRNLFLTHLLTKRQEVEN